MRALTPEEVCRLETSSLPTEQRTVVYPHAEQIFPALESRGLVTRVRRFSWRGKFVTANHITPRGQLALRVHRAYLASLGGA